MARFWIPSRQKPHRLQLDRYFTRLLQKRAASVKSLQLYPAESTTVKFILLKE